MASSGVKARIIGGLVCAAVGALGLLPLLPTTAAGQTAVGGLLTQAGGVVAAAPNSTALCPVPTLADTTVGATTTYAVTVDSPPGEPPALGTHVGQKGSWVTLNGTNLQSFCTTSIFVGGVQQTVSPPPADASNPTPPANTPTSLTFVSTGDSGPVTVVLTAPAGQGSNVSNNNFTYLAPPTVTAVSTAAPTEQSTIELTGSGFSLGGVPGSISTAFYSGGTPSTASLCDTTTGSIGSDTGASIYAPATYCSGVFDVRLTAPYNTSLPQSDPANQGNAVPVSNTEQYPIRVAPVISSVSPSDTRPGAQVTVTGTGFGFSGAARVGNQPVPVSDWRDRSITLNIPSGASSGTLRLTRSDGTAFSAGSLNIAPLGVQIPGGSVVAGGSPLGPIGLSAGAAGQPPAAPGLTGAAASGQELPVTGAAAVGTAPIGGPVRYLTTPVSLSVFMSLAVVILVAAFIFGFLNAGRLLLYARRSRRAAASARVALGSQVATALSTVGFKKKDRELRLGRHVRNVEVVGRATPLGHLLLRDGIIDRHALSESLRQHRQESRPLGEVLVARGAASEDSVWSTLGEQWGISLGDLDSHWIDASLAQSLTAVDSIKYRMLVIRAVGDNVIVAMADPFNTQARSHAERCLGRTVVPILATPGAIRRRQEQVYSASLLEESVVQLQREQPEASAHMLTTRPQRIAAAATGVVMLCLAIIFGGGFFIGLAAGVVALYALVVTFRTYVIIRGAKYQDVIRVSDAEIDELTDLPVYTILCPLYREAGVLPQLVEACSALDYPSSLLDVKLLLEADDTETLEVVSTYPLPPYFDVVVVPAEGPRTKPKACNYGLQFARGEYVVIFDAEDIPEPDQLKKAIATFRRSGPEVGCVQAKLNFYNPRQNALTGWFALEYTAWFDFFLPGLVDLRMPVPLGGSSNHFPTSLLRTLNAWDPNNVTEDADLGMRLHRAGYHTVIMESTTFEEANSDFVNWVKQRSRWGKGYAVSWLVQMRHPRTLLRELGWKNFMAVQLTLGGTFGVAVLNLLVWMLTLLWILAQFNFIAYLFPSAIYYVGMLELLVGNFFFLYMGVWSCQHRKSWELTQVALLAPLYWLMMSLAMLKASLQLVTKPTYWEKTAHGLFDHPATIIPSEAADVRPAVARLTGSRGAVVPETASVEATPADETLVAPR